MGHGDGAVYLGREMEHWRERFNGHPSEGGGGAATSRRAWTPAGSAAPSRSTVGPVSLRGPPAPLCRPVSVCRRPGHAAVGAAPVTRMSEGALRTRALAVTAYRATVLTNASGPAPASGPWPRSTVPER